jgi:hypothetical protein
MSYAIAILPDMYQGQPNRAKFYAANEHDVSNGIYDTYDTIDEARVVVDNIADYTYYLSSGEAGRPEYMIVDDEIASYITSGRNSDGGNYDWIGCDCDKQDGKPCGDCDDCLAYMSDEDRDYLRNHSIS